MNVRKWIFFLAQIQNKREALRDLYRPAMDKSALEMLMKEVEKEWLAG